MCTSVGLKRELHPLLAPLSVSRALRAAVETQESQLKGFPGAIRTNFTQPNSVEAWEDALAAYAAGVSPAPSSGSPMASYDLVMLPYSRLQDLAVAGRLADLASIASIDSRFGRHGVHGTVLDLVLSADKLLGVPLDGGQLLLYARADVLAHLGLPVPRSWQELLQVSAAANGTAAQTLERQEQGRDDGNGGARYLQAARPIFGFCLPPSSQSLGQLVLAMLAPMVQHRGRKQGMYLDADTLRPAISTAGMPHVLSYLRQLATVSPPVSPSASAPPYSDDFALGRCALTVGTAAQFRRNSHAAHPAGPSAVAGRVTASLLPGSELILSGGTLEPCDAELCRYSDSYTTGGALSTTPATNSALAQPLGGTAAAGDSASAVEGQAATARPELNGGSEGQVEVLVNRAPLLAPDGLLGSLNGGAEVLAQLYSWFLLGSVGGPDESWTLMLDPASEVGPWREAHMDASASGLAPWVAAGFDPTDTASFLDAARASLDHPNAVLPLRVRAADQYHRAVRDAVAAFLPAAWEAEAVGDAGAAASLIAVAERRALVYMQDATAALFPPGGNHFASIRQEYRRSLGVADTAGPERQEAPTRKATSGSSSPNTVTIVAAVLGSLAGALLLLLVALTLVRMAKRRRQRRRGWGWRVVDPPCASPDTVLLVTDIEGSTSLWECLPEDVMDAALRTHHATVRNVGVCYGAYESATEGDSFILAFHSAPAAAQFSLGLQRALLAATWPTKLLAVPSCAPIYVRRLEAVARAHQVSLAPALRLMPRAARGGPRCVTVAAASGPRLQSRQAALESLAGHSRSPDAAVPAAQAPGGPTPGLRGASPCTLQADAVARRHRYLSKREPGAGAASGIRRCSEGSAVGAGVALALESGEPPRCSIELEGASGGLDGGEGSQHGPGAGSGSGTRSQARRGGARQGSTKARVTAAGELWRLVANSSGPANGGDGPTAAPASHGGRSRRRSELAAGAYLLRMTAAAEDEVNGYVSSGGRSEKRARPWFSIGAGPDATPGGASGRRSGPMSGGLGAASAGASAPWHGATGSPAAALDLGCARNAALERQASPEQRRQRSLGAPLAFGTPGMPDASSPQSTARSVGRLRRASLVLSSWLGLGGGGAGSEGFDSGPLKAAVASPVRYVAGGADGAAPAASGGGGGGGGASARGGGFVRWLAGPGAPPADAAVAGYGAETWTARDAVGRHLSHQNLWLQLRPRRNRRVSALLPQRAQGSFAGLAGLAASLLQTSASALRRPRFTDRGPDPTGGKSSPGRRHDRAAGGDGEDEDRAAGAVGDGLPCAWGTELGVPEALCGRAVPLDEAAAAGLDTDGAQRIDGETVAMLAAATQPRLRPADIAAVFSFVQAEANSDHHTLSGLGRSRRSAGSLHDGPQSSSARGPDPAPSAIMDAPDANPTSMAGPLVLPTAVPIPPDASFQLVAPLQEAPCIPVRSSAARSRRPLHHYSSSTDLRVAPVSPPPVLQTRRSAPLPDGGAAEEAPGCMGPPPPSGALSLAIPQPSVLLAPGHGPGHSQGASPMLFRSIGAHMNSPPDPLAGISAASVGTSAGGARRESGGSGTAAAAALHRRFKELAGEMAFPAGHTRATRSSLTNPTAPASGAPPSAHASVPSPRWRRSPGGADGLRAGSLSAAGLVNSLMDALGHRSFSRTLRRGQPQPEGAAAAAVADGAPPDNMDMDMGAAACLAATRSSPKAAATTAGAVEDAAAVPAAPGSGLRGLQGPSSGLRSGQLLAMSSRLRASSSCKADGEPLSEDVRRAGSGRMTSPAATGTRLVSTLPPMRGQLLDRGKDARDGEGRYMTAPELGDEETGFSSSRGASGQASRRAGTLQFLWDTLSAPGLGGRRSERWRRMGPPPALAAAVGTSRPLSPGLKSGLGDDAMKEDSGNPKRSAASLSQLKGRPGGISSRGGDSSVAEGFASLRFSSHAVTALEPRPLYPLPPLQPQPSNAGGATGAVGLLPSAVPPRVAQLAAGSAPGGLVHSSSTSGTQLLGAVNGASKGSRRNLPTQGSLLELLHRVFVPVSEEELAPDAVLVFAGLRVRVGMSCGITDPRDIQYNPATARMTFSGDALRIAKAVCDCASGGQIIMSGEVLLRLQLSGAGGSLVSQQLVLNWQAHVLDLGDHQLLEPPPAALASPRKVRQAAPVMPVSRHLLHLTSSSLLGRLPLMLPVRSALRQYTAGCVEAPYGENVTIVVLRVSNAPALVAWNAAVAAESMALLELYLRASLGSLHAQTSSVSAPPFPRGHGTHEPPRLLCYLAAAPPGSPFGTFVAGFSQPAAAARWALHAVERMAGLPWPEELLETPWARPLEALPLAEAEAIDLAAASGAGGAGAAAAAAAAGGASQARSPVLSSSGDLAGRSGAAGGGGGGHPLRHNSGRLGRLLRSATLSAVGGSEGGLAPPSAVHSGTTAALSQQRQIARHNGALRRARSGVFGSGNGGPPSRWSAPGLPGGAGGAAGSGIATFASRGGQGPDVNLSGSAEANGTGAAGWRRRSCGRRRTECAAGVRSATLDAAGHTGSGRAWDSWFIDRTASGAGVLSAGSSRNVKAARSFQVSRSRLRPPEADVQLHFNPLLDDQLDLAPDTPLTAKPSGSTPPTPMAAAVAGPAGGVSAAEAEAVTPRAVALKPLDIMLHGESAAVSWQQGGEAGPGASGIDVSAGAQATGSRTPVLASSDLSVVAGVTMVAMEAISVGADRQSLEHMEVEFALRPGTGQAEVAGLRGSPPQDLKPADGSQPRMIPRTASSRNRLAALRTPRPASGPGMGAPHHHHYHQHQVQVQGSVPGMSILGVTFMGAGQRGAVYRHVDCHRVGTSELSARPETPLVRPYSGGSVQPFATSPSLASPASLQPAVTSPTVFGEEGAVARLPVLPRHGHALEQCSAVGSRGVLVAASQAHPHPLHTTMVVMDSEPGASQRFTLGSLNTILPTATSPPSAMSPPAVTAGAVTQQGLWVFPAQSPPKALMAGVTHGSIGVVDTVDAQAEEAGLAAWPGAATGEQPQCQRPRPPVLQCLASDDDEEASMGTVTAHDGAAVSPTVTGVMVSGEGPYAQRSSPSGGAGIGSGRRPHSAADNGPMAVAMPRRHQTGPAATPGMLESPAIPLRLRNRLRQLTTSFSTLALRLHAGTPSAAPSPGLPPSISSPDPAGATGGGGGGGALASLRPTSGLRPSASGVFRTAGRKGQTLSEGRPERPADARVAAMAAASEARSAEDGELVTMRGLRVRVGLSVGAVRLELCPLTGRVVYSGKTVTAAMTAAAGARLGTLYVTRAAAAAIGGLEGEQPTATAAAGMGGVSPRDPQVPDGMRTSPPDQPSLPVRGSLHGGLDCGAVPANRGDVLQDPASIAVMAKGQPQRPVGEPAGLGSRPGGYGAGQSEPLPKVNALAAPTAEPTLRSVLSGKGIGMLARTPAAPRLSSTTVLGLEAAISDRGRHLLGPSAAGNDECHGGGCGGGVPSFDGAGVGSGGGEGGGPSIAVSSAGEVGRCGAAANTAGGNGSAASASGRLRAGEPGPPRLVCTPATGKIANSLAAPLLNPKNTPYRCRLAPSASPPPWDPPR